MLSTFRLSLSPEGRRATGMAALIFAAGYAWLSVIAKPYPAEAFLLFAMTLTSTLLAGRASQSGGTRVLLLLLTMAGIGSLVFSVHFEGALRDFLKTRGWIAAACCMAGLLWGGAAGGPWGRQRRVLFAVSAAVAAPLLTRAGYVGKSALSGGAGLLLTIVFGAALYLWEDGNPGQQVSGGKAYLLQTASLILVTGVLILALSGSVYAAASKILGTAVDIAISVVLFVLRPVGMLMEYLVVMIQKRLDDLPERPVEFDFKEALREPGFDEIADRGPTILMTVLEYALTVAVVLTVAYLVWRFLKSLESRRQNAAQAAVESKANKRTFAEWAAEKGKDLVAATVQMVKDMLPQRKREPDPLMRLYGDFLSLAKECGCERRPSQTPLEFALEFGKAVQPAAGLAQFISVTFSRHLYGGTRPSREEMDSLDSILSKTRMVIGEHKAGNRSLTPVDAPQNA